MWNEQKILLTISEPCLNPDFPQEQLKNCHVRKIFESLRGPVTWRVVPRNVWNDLVCWQTRRPNNSTKYQLLALTTIISEKKNGNPWENCRMFALKLFWNAFSWHALDDLIFYGQWTNLHDQSQNGPKHVTKRLFRLIPYIHQTCEYTILSCGKHCKTVQIRTFSRLRCNRRSWEFKIYVKWNIVHFRKPFICANQMDVWETNFSFTQFNRIRSHFFGCKMKVGRYNPHLIYGIWSSQFFTETWIRMIKNGETCLLQRERKFMERLMIQTRIWIMLILFSQTCILLLRNLCCISSKTTKQWSRWS